MITFPAVNADHAAEKKRTLGRMGSTGGIGEKSNASPPVTKNDITKNNNIAYLGKQYTEEHAMGSPSREEIDAKLGQNKAEIELISANMRAEISAFREFQSKQFTAMNQSLNEIKGLIFASNGEVAGLKGQIDGIKTSMTATQWLVGAVLAMLAVIITLPQIQSYFKVSEPTAKEAASETHDTKIKQ
ncbi:TPA: CCDC90 family protein [Escherichia coli]|uniref:CCDC90 family protein n=1 Tax=Escherichia coli TaxID=562 RepID=UPI00208DC4D6|nr:CCDC90 family protein [Escherichia coli]